MCCEHLRFLLYIFDAAEAFTSATYNNNNTHKQLYAQIIICTKKSGVSRHPIFKNKLLKN